MALQELSSCDIYNINTQYREKLACLKKEEADAEAAKSAAKNSEVERIVQ